MEQNKEKVLEIIRKKMKEGYTFFTTKTYMFGKVKCKSQITTRDLNRGSVKEIVITDKQFEKMVSDMEDRDIAELVSKNQAEIVRPTHKRELMATKRAKTAEEVLGKDSLAIKPVRGG